MAMQKETFSCRTNCHNIFENSAKKLFGADFPAQKSLRMSKNNKNKEINKSVHNSLTKVFLLDSKYN